MVQLQELLKPHMLRRMKKDVPDLDIPDKRELVVPVELSSEQKEVYRAILTKNMDVLRKARIRLVFGGRGLLVTMCLVGFELIQCACVWFLGGNIIKLETSDDAIRWVLIHLLVGKAERCVLMVPL